MSTSSQTPDPKGRPVKQCGRVLPHPTHLTIHGRQAYRCLGIAAAPTEPQEPLSTEQLAEIREAAVQAVKDHPSTTFMAPYESLADAVLAAVQPALFAEIERLNGELAFFAARVNELESRYCECQPVREHDDYKRPAAYQHAATCPVTDASITRDGGAR